MPDITNDTFRFVCRCGRKWASKPERCTGQVVVADHLFEEATEATEDAKSDILTDIRDVLEADVFKWLGSVVDKPKSMGGILQRAHDEMERLRAENTKLWDNVAHLASHHANEHRECDHTVDGRNHG